MNLTRASMLTPMRAMALGFLLAAGACASTSTDAGPQPGTSAGGGASSFGGKAGGVVSNEPVGRKLIEDAIDSPKTYELHPNAGDGHGLGKMAIVVEGRNLWPPAGPGCAELVRCCNELVTLTENMALACILAVGRDGDCATALRTSLAIAREGGLGAPPSCLR